MQSHKQTPGTAGEKHQPPADGAGRLSLPKFLRLFCGDVSATAHKMALDVDAWAASDVSRAHIQAVPHGCMNQIKFQIQRWIKFQI